MPPESFFDISTLDQSKVLADHAAIYRVNPHRYEFELLDGILHMDREAGILVGYRDVKADEFWVRGHIPGRPIFPGVLMIESAAQLVSYYVTSEHPEKGFMGFGGVEGVKFRGAVVPGDRVILVGKRTEERSRRVIADTQGYVNGALVFTGTITGMWI
jgi:3-hydroxyacyl-[acyl-carrier-protein] dehydratase